MVGKERRDGTSRRATTGMCGERYGHKLVPRGWSDRRNVPHVGHIDHTDNDLDHMDPSPPL